MVNNEGIIINKYGAVDVKVIVELIHKVDFLTVLVDELLGINTELGEYPIKDHIRRSNVIQLIEDFKKIKQLTKCDDYEFQTTTETKLVKKEATKNEK
jgi:hypothetical protein